MEVVRQRPDTGAHDQQRAVHTLILSGQATTQQLEAYRDAAMTRLWTQEPEVIFDAAQDERPEVEPLRQAFRKLKNASGEDLQTAAREYATQQLSSLEVPATK